MTITYRLLIIALCLPCLLLAGLPAQTAPETKLPLRVSGGDGITLTAANAAVYQFGVRRLPTPGDVSAVFSLQNETGLPLTIDRLQPTCHCTQAETLPSETGTRPLPPGGSVSVRVTVRLAGHAPGPLRKSVLVFVAGQSDPAAQLDMAGTLAPPPAPTP